MMNILFCIANRGLMGETAAINEGTLVRGFSQAWYYKQQKVSR